MGWDGYGYKPYVPVAKRRAQAAKEVARRLKKGLAVSPVQIEGRTIAASFWGKAWCANLESYSDFANRLPRGRTYVRNGSVVHLTIDKGRIEALVSGSELYTIKIEITALAKADWQALKQKSAGQIGSLVELLKGKLSKGVMELVTDPDRGLFPKPKEIKMRCSCPDGASMCKHIAATMYGVGNRLDSSPELLFVLRGVDHLELIEQAIPTAPLKSKKTSSAPTLATDDLGAIFGIEIDDAPAPAPKAASKKSRAGSKAAAPKAAAPIPKKPAAKPAATKARAGRKAAAPKAAVPISIPKPAAKPAATKARAGSKASAPIPVPKPAATKAPAKKEAPATKKAKTRSKPVSK